MTCANTNLTPTVITDRNGKVTTVHKKDSSPAKASRSMPAPVISPAAHSSSLERVLSLVSTKKYEGTPPDAEGVRRLHELLADKDTGEINFRDQALVAMLTKRQNEVVCAALESKEGFLSTLEAMQGDCTVKQMSGFAAVYEPDIFIAPEVSDLTEEQRGTLNANRFSEAYPRIKRYDLLGLDYTVYGDVSALKQHDKDVVSSFFRLYGAMSDINQKNLIPQELINYATSPETDAKEIASVIRSTGSADVSVIRGIIDGIEPSVAEGWL